MVAKTPTAERPMFLSADKRKLSYRSKSGRVLTLELKNSNAINSLQQLDKKYPKDGTTTTITVDKIPSAGLWPQLFDTLSLYVEEAIEVACFGPYDDLK